jgi:hypothetical protein
MFRNMLFAAVLTLSAFAATGAHAAAGQGDQPRFASAGGSYAFTNFCVPVGITSHVACRNGPCKNWAPGFYTFCYTSFDKRQTSNTHKQGDQRQGFSQGKFHSK